MVVVRYGDMALLSSLPSRPFTDDELYALHTSRKFVAVTPINAVTDSDKERQRSLIIGAIFVTDKIIVATQYDPTDRNWISVFKGANEPESKKNLDGFVNEVYDAAEAALEDAAYDLEETGAVSKVVDRDVDPDGEVAFRDAAEFGEVLQQHYDEAA